MRTTITVLTSIIKQRRMVSEAILLQMDMVSRKHGATLIVVILQCKKQPFEVLRSTGCRWWVIELGDVEELLQTKNLIDGYLMNS